MPPIKLCGICASSRVWALSIGLTPRDLSKERAWTLCKCVRGKKRGERSGPLGLHCNSTWICCFQTSAGSVGKFSWNQTRWGLRHQRWLYYELPESSSDSAADGFCFLTPHQPQSPEEQSTGWLCLQSRSSIELLGRRKPPARRRQPVICFPYRTTNYNKPLGLQTQISNEY